MTELRMFQSVESALIDFYYRLPCAVLLHPEYAEHLSPPCPLTKVYAPHWYGIGRTIAWTLRQHQRQLRDNIQCSNQLLTRLRAKECK